MSTMLIFELDGGSWHMIEPLMAQGGLPNLARLVHSGASGVLHSIAPYISPAVWTTIYTGQPRERHGVRAFDATSGDVRFRRLWDVACEHGVACGLCGSMVSWPPDDVGGFVIPDIMARDPTTIPPKYGPIQELVLEGRADARANAGSRPTRYVRRAVQLRQLGIPVRTLAALARDVLVSAILCRSQGDTYWRRMILLQELYADAFVQLFRDYRPGLATYHYHAVDTLSHLYWRQAEDGRDKGIRGGPLEAAYEHADQILGKLLDAVGPDATVVVLSDHGFTRSPEDWPRYRVRLTRLIQSLGLQGAAFPTRIAHQHFLYFDDGEQAHGVAETLRSMRYKGTNASVLSRVHTRDSAVYFPPPRIQGEGRTVVIPGHGELPFSELFEETGHLATGMHAGEGIVVLAGPGVRQGCQIKDASILDVAPTVLALFGLPVASDMDGRIWLEAIRPGHLRASPPRYVHSYRWEGHQGRDSPITAREIEVLQERLRNLGYL